MISFSIFGTGAMGSALRELLSGGGATVQVITRSDDVTIEGDAVVLAVPYDELQAIAADHREQLIGKIVVDITNPVDFDTFDSLKVAAESSAAAELQADLPDSIVIKAFNTTFAATLTAKNVGPNRTVVLVVGDDAAAKQTLIDALASAGVGGIDAGPLKRARELEALGFLQLTLANDEKIDWSSGFAVVV